LDAQAKETVNITVTPAAPSTPQQRQPAPAPSHQVPPASAPVFHAQQAPVYSAPVFQDLPKIIGLPDPSSNKVYRLQVGAFSTVEAADRLVRQVTSLGFQAMQEKSGTMFRVLAVNVPAAMVQYAAQRLASTGIKEIWVRE
jgi:cell division protein FtsN